MHRVSSQTPWIFRLPLLGIVLLSLAACQTNDEGPPCSGTVAPTVAGGATSSAYANYQEARTAFTRGSADGVVIATLEDSNWLKFEGPPEEVQANHRGYFEYGYTTFNVTLRARAFTRPTNETFLLEDSRGARITSKPVTFKGNMLTVDDRWQFEFDLSFQHTITQEVAWIRLTRISDGETVEWGFGG